MNYQTCTIEELAAFFMSKTSQAITQQLMYYRQQNNDDIVLKIKKARILCKQRKLAEKLEGM